MTARDTCPVCGCDLSGVDTGVCPECHPPAKSGERPATIFQRGIISLTLTQFWGAANDNILKIVLTYMLATGIWATADETTASAVVGKTDGREALPFALLAIPFLLLSGFAGQVSDRYSKRTVMLTVKIVEIPIAIIGCVGFLAQHQYITLAAMLMLAIQSAFFGPAKYGVIPELVDDVALSRANGVVSMMTNLAIIAGTLIGGPVSDLYFPGEGVDRSPILWAPGIVLISIALAGLVSIIPMPRVPAGNRDLRYDFNPFGFYLDSYREMAKGPIMIVAIAWAAFQMIGTMALLTLPMYEDILAINYTRTSYIIGAMGVAIGLGSLTCGLLSGQSIKPRFVVVGAIGMTIFFALLGLVPPDYVNVIIFISGAGFFAGFYIIPLQALIQHLAPVDKRGSYIGATGGLSWSFVLAGCLTYYVATGVAGIDVNRVFLICAALSCFGTTIAMLRLRDYLKRPV